MRTALILTGLVATCAHAQESTERENARHAAREIHTEIQANYPALRRTVVSSSTCNPETGQILRPEDPRDPSIPCVALHFESEELAAQLKTAFGFKRNGVLIAYRYRPPGSNVAFAADEPSESNVTKVTRDLESIFSAHDGVVSVGMAVGPATSAMISVADPETQRMLLEEYPPGSTLHGIPITIERQQTLDARDPVVSPPCEPSLVNKGWARFKRRVKRFFQRPIS